MKQYLRNLTDTKTFLFIIVTLLCLVVAFRYRNRNYWMIPPVSDTFDEYATAWVGYSILKTGVPTSWSYIPDYALGNPQNVALSISDMSILVNGERPSLSNYYSFPKPLLLTTQLELEGYRSHFNIVTPHLEQPPLGGLLISLPLLLTQAKSFSDVSLKTIRGPFVLYGVFSTLLVILIASMLYGKKIGLISGVMYATVPSIVIGSRLALPENILTLLLLLEVYFLTMYQKTKNNRFIKLAFIIAFISPLIKPFGLSAALVAAGYSVMIFNNYKMAVRFILVGTLSFLSYILYGIIVDQKTFISLFNYQSARFFSGPQVLITKIIIPKITKIFYDGWIFWGWISFFYLSLIKKQKEYLFILIPIISYLIVLGFFGGEDYGWYRLPLYPFLTISAGVVIAKILQSRSIFPSFAFLLIVVSFVLQWGFGIQNWNIYLNNFRIIFVAALFFVLFSVWQGGKYRKLSQIFLAIVFVYSLYLNTRIINNMGNIWPKLGDDSALILDRK